MPGPNDTSNMTAVHAREIDFVSRFSANWQGLTEILGIVNPIRKAPGTKLEAYRVTFPALEASPAEGAAVTYSKPTFTPVTTADVTVEKYAAATTVEAVAKYGAQAAVEKTDDAFLAKLQNKVLNDFYTFVQTGTLTSTEASFQMAIAMALGNVKAKWQDMDLGYTGVAVFVNTLDAYRYLGAAGVTIQNQFGLQYIEDFMGADILILTDKVPASKVIATPVDNIQLYYVDPADSDFAKLGLEYTVEGETNLIGFHAQGDYKTAVGEVFALMGMALWAEYLDGIAVVTVAANASDLGD